MRFRSYVAFFVVPVALWTAFVVSVAFAERCTPQSPGIEIGSMLVGGCR